MDKTELITGQLVQLNPETVRNKAFTGCIMVITEPKDFGAMGYVQALGEKNKPGDRAYYRAGWEEMESVGYVEWMVL